MVSVRRNARGKLLRMVAIDAAILQYQAIDSISHPNEQQREAIHTFLYSQSLGGNCGFLGRDFCNRAPFTSLFDNLNRNDLLFLGENFGEDDFLTRMLLGPGMDCFHQIWMRIKVSKNL